MNISNLTLMHIEKRQQPEVIDIVVTLFDLSLCDLLCAFGGTFYNKLH